MQNKLHQILVALLFGILLLPITQLTVQLFVEPPLEGIGATSAAPSFKWANWMRGTFQDTLMDHATKHVGFHNTFVRLNNQYYYSLFNTALANHVIIGQDDYLYDIAHIRAYTGEDYLGEETLRNRMRDIHDLQEILLKKGIRLMVAFVPGKATGTPEHLPIGTAPAGKQTNYKTYLRFADSLGVPALDLIAWYQHEKKRSTFPLYPSGGIHWSQYCATIAMDTTLGFLSQLMQTPFNRMQIEDIEWSPTPRGQDHDIERGMNLLFPHRGSPMAYPKVKWTGIEPKFNVMTVGDSYYFKAFTDFSGACFAKSSLWFYHNELHTWGSMVPMHNEQVDVLKQIEAQDLIILFTADANLKEFSWGFVEDALRRYRDPAWREPEITRLSNDIRNDANWMKLIAEKAMHDGVSVDSMLRRDAIHVLEHTRIK
jgi:hypothetical protein